MVGGEESVTKFAGVSVSRAIEVIEGASDNDATAVRQHDTPHQSQ